MDADLDTLAVALYARIDDTLKDQPELGPWRPQVGIAPKLSHAELLTLAALQVLSGHANESVITIRASRCTSACATARPIGPAPTTRANCPGWASARHTAWQPIPSV